MLFSYLIEIFIFLFLPLAFIAGVVLITVAFFSPEQNDYKIKDTAIHKCKKGGTINSSLYWEGGGEHQNFLLSYQ